MVINFLKKIWLDPVGSKVISVIIVALGLNLVAYISSLLSNSSFMDVVLTIGNFLLIKIEIYWVLILVSIFMLTKQVKSTIKRDKTFDSKIKIGDYSFEELHHVLSTIKLSFPTNTTSKESDLLTIFIGTISEFSIGVKFDHPGHLGTFLYYKAGPKLISLGLLEKVEFYDEYHKINTYSIQVSELGKKFYTMLEKLRFYNESKSLSNNLHINHNRNEHNDENELPQKLEILEAWYGTENKKFNVTWKLNNLIKNDKLIVSATNDFFGEPDYGTIKKLSIKYKFDKTISLKEYSEGELVQIPI